MAAATGASGSTSSSVKGQVEVRVAEKRLGGGKACGEAELRKSP